MRMASLLKKLVDAEQWDAEDIAGRLGMVLHAAFLFAGFQPYGAQPRSGHLLKRQSCGSLCLSRQYTAPELAHREGAEDSAVLMLCVQGGDDVALLTTADGGGAPENAYLERLDLGTVTPLLSHSLGGVEPWASRICKSLADGVCWGFLDELCRRNGGLPPLTGFTSLPDDLKGAVLEKLTDGKDLARVECVSSELRLLVAERDVELWQTLYKALPDRQCHRCHLWWYLWKTLSPHEMHNPGSSWKDKYVVEAMQRSHRKWMGFSCYFDSFDPNQMGRRNSRPLEYWLFEHPPEEENEETVSMRVWPSGGNRRKQGSCHRTTARGMWNGGGAIHSPSSRYRWKHR